MKKYFSTSRILLRVLTILLFLGLIFIKQYTEMSNLFSAILQASLLLIFFAVDRRLSRQPM